MLQGIILEAIFLAEYLWQILYGKDLSQSWHTGWFALLLNLMLSGLPQPGTLSNWPSFQVLTMNTLARN